MRVNVIVSSLPVAILAGCITPSTDADGTSGGGGKADAFDPLPVSASGLDVNDVSILYPMPRTAEQLDTLPGLSMALADGRPLLDQDTLDRFLDRMIVGEAPVGATSEELAARQGPAIDLTGQSNLELSPDDTRDIDGWRIVGLRFDPVTPDVRVDPVAPPRTSQLRMVAQPFVVTGSGLEFQDVALHLIYGFDLPDEASKRALDARIALDLRRLKAASPAPTTGVPLGVHPGLAAAAPFAPGGDDRFASLVRELLVVHVAEARLRSIAMAGLRGGGDVWVFAAAVVAPDGSFVNQPLPHVGGQTFVELNLDQTAPPDQAVIPRPLTPRQLADAFALGGSAPFDAAIASIAAIDNPRLTHVGNVDCVSCHVSTQRAYFSGENHRFFDERLIGMVGLGCLPDSTCSGAGARPVSSELYPLPAGVTGFVRRDQAQSGIWHVGNFRYVGITPNVSQRTANESAEAANFLNHEIIEQTGGNPALDCSGPAQAAATLCHLAGRADCRTLCR